MPTSRSREAIQSEIDALTAELAAAQPDVIAVESYTGTRKLKINKDQLGGRTQVKVTATSSFPAAKVGMWLELSEAGVVRDWLNYHFPKETI